jgi:hypothetical protein
MERGNEGFRDSSFIANASSHGNSMLGLAALTLAETEDNLIRARKIEGMMNVKLLVLKEVREYTRWMDSAIDRKITETAREQQ